MGSSSKNGYPPIDSGSPTGELTEGQRRIPLTPAPSYQGYAGQPFDERAQVYPSFLPGKAGQSATGLDQAMLDAIMGISPRGAGAGRSPAGATDPAEPTAHGGDAQPGMSIPQLSAPPEGSMRGWFRDAAQQVADSSNKAGDLGQYLDAREQLARLVQLGQFARPGFTGGHSPSYGPGHVGGSASNRAGMGGLSSGGVY